MSIMSSNYELMTSRNTLLYTFHGKSSEYGGHAAQTEKWWQPDWELWRTFQAAGHGETAPVCLGQHLPGSEMLSSLVTLLSKVAFLLKSA